MKSKSEIKAYISLLESPPTELQISQNERNSIIQALKWVLNETPNP